MKKRSKVTLESVVAVGMAALAGAWAVRRLTRGGHRFSGQTVLITGGSRGLGLELARRFAKEGARLAICARDEAELRRAEEELTRSGARVFAQTCDVTDAAQVASFLQGVRETLGPVDVLVNNAGIIQVGPAEAMRFEDFDQAMQTHFYGPLRLILALRDELAQRRGRIVNIASIGGKVPAPHLLPYDASKFALVGLSEGFHVELRQHGIHVTTVCPGLMRTGSPTHALFKGRREAEHAWFTLGDSLPYLSIASDEAAKQIVEACREGRAELILTGRAKLLARFAGVAPGLLQGLLVVANAFLPRANGDDTTMSEGKEVETPLTRSVLTWLTQRAAVRNNELS